VRWLLLSIALAAVGCSTNIDPGFLPTAVAISSDEDSNFSFPSVGIGNSSPRVLTLRNLGLLPVTEIEISGLNSIFSFVGGSYPGTDGTCSSALGSGESCTLSLQYSPVETAAATTTLAISFNYGNAHQSFELALTGEPRTTGYFDPTFAGGNGYAMYDLGAGSAASATVNAIGVDANQRYYAVGQVSNDAFIVRFTSDGNVDSTFGSGGRVTEDLFANDYAYGIAVQPDGKILAGFSGSATNWRGFVYRYESNGTLDTSFGTGGRAEVAPALTDEVILYSLELLPDGDILVAGHGRVSGTTYSPFVSRLNPDGSPNSAFATNGSYNFIPNYGFQGRAIYDAVNDYFYIGSYVTGPSIYEGMRRLDGTGAIDTDFGTGGEVKILYNMNTPVGGYAPMLQNNNVLYTQLSTISAETHCTLARLNKIDGSQDMSFGETGWLVAPAGTGQSACPSAVLNDGQIVLGNAVDTPDDTHKVSSLLWYDANGLARSTVGPDENGRTTFSFGQDDTIRALQRLADGKILTLLLSADSGGRARVTLARILP